MSMKLKLPSGKPRDLQGIRAPLFTQFPMTRAGLKDVDLIRKHLCFEGFLATT